MRRKKCVFFEVFPLSRRAAVALENAAQAFFADNLAARERNRSRWFVGWVGRLQRFVAHSLMWPRLVVKMHVFIYEVTQVILAEAEKMVEAFGRSRAPTVRRKHSCSACASQPEWASRRNIVVSAKSAATHLDAA